MRQALAYAVDADEIIKGVMDGKAVRVPTMLTSLHFGFDPSLKPIKQDLAKSKKLLADAGFPNGLEIVLNGPQGRYVRDKEVAEAVAGQLTKAGIKTTLRTYEFVSYLNNMVYVHKAGPVWLIGWGHPTMDAEAIYVPLFKTPNIFANWHNEDFNGMVEEAQSQMDEKKRLAQYQRINKLWIEEVPAIPLYQQIDLYGANKRVTWKARSDELIRAYDMSLKDGSNFEPSPAVRVPNLLGTSDGGSTRTELVEAVGIEPTSESPRRQASTSIADYLLLSLLGPPIGGISERPAPKVSSRTPEQGLGPVTRI